MVTIYNFPGCGVSESIKNFLNHKNISYTTVNMEETFNSSKEILIQKGISVESSLSPYVVTDTDAWQGFNLEKLSSLIQN